MYGNAYPQAGGTSYGVPGTEGYGSYGYQLPNGYPPYNTDYSAQSMQPPGENPVPVEENPFDRHAPTIEWVFLIYE